MKKSTKKTVKEDDRSTKVRWMEFRSHVASDWGVEGALVFENLVIADLFEGCGRTVEDLSHSLPFLDSEALPKILLALSSDGLVKSKSRQGTMVYRPTGRGLDYALYGEASNG